VPPEVVRAHFAGALGEADTRAPLLTGGISFGRMVPMRLLPFRVICVLGLNDGDFPRRDPAAGLNQLTAELDTPRRRPGDRSTREDDRFLFLQLFAAAQEVFYLSYLGADPRDGSAREPSVLVSELIDAAAAYHLDPPAAVRDFTVRHALQPFSPAAFGDGDPRRFSYRRQWHPAAGRLTGQRGGLQPWFDAPLPPPPTMRWKTRSRSIPCAASCATRPGSSSHSRWACAWPTRSRRWMTWNRWCCLRAGRKSAACRRRWCAPRSAAIPSRCTRACARVACCRRVHWASASSRWSS
jgi:hypothetical protein